jgi:malate dehydrogenase (quinone)
MIEVLKQNFKKEFPKWEPKLRELIPSYGTRLSDHSKKAATSLSATAKSLKIK